LVNTQSHPEFKRSERLPCGVFDIPLSPDCALPSALSPWCRKWLLEIVSALIYALSIGWPRPVAKVRTNHSRHEVPQHIVEVKQDPEACWSEIIWVGREKENLGRVMAFGYFLPVLARPFFLQVLFIADKFRFRLSRI
jgi:hypothetical protein